MAYFVLAFFSMLLGGAGAYFVLHSRFVRLEALTREREALNDVTRGRLDANAAALQKASANLATQRVELDREIAAFRKHVAEHSGHIVQYDELVKENALLKRDLRSLDTHRRKLHLDQERIREEQAELAQRCKEVAGRYLRENVKWIGSSLTATNFVTCKQRLCDVVGRCRGIGLDISATEEAELVDDLKTEFERLVRAAFEREEQVRIRARIREEQQREREIERELKQIERERSMIQTALERALATTADQHSAEIENLRRRLAEAEARSQRAISQAQLTKAGHIYVISNIGTFGEGVFKIGMTRRLEPVDRIRELGDASVPFGFDVHMMISCEDAPRLENALHRALHKMRVNRVNPRKEFFRVSLDDIRKIVEAHHGTVEFQAECAASEYRQSLCAAEADQEYIESVYDKFDDDGEPVDD